MRVTISPNAVRGTSAEALATRVRAKRENEEFWRNVQSIMHGFSMSINSRSHPYVNSLCPDVSGDPEDSEL